ncbi:MAG: beta-ketoacyl-[acyl-carrier-protein] synthase family protein [Bdellovibrio sp.]
MTKNRIVITGASMITPLGDEVATQMEKMYAGVSAIKSWSRISTENIFSKIGGDLGDRSALEGLEKIKTQLPEEIYKKAYKLISKAPWSTGHSIELALRAALDSRWFDSKTALDSTACIVGGTNIGQEYIFEQHKIFHEEPDYIDPFFSLYSLDTDHAGCVSESLGIKGGSYVIGGACASASMAIRSAMDEILYHDLERVLVVGAIYAPSASDLHSLAIMGAISINNFNEHPEKSSRPFDKNREGFLPAHGGAALVFERLDVALARKAKIYGELLGAEISSDGNHLPQPSKDGQVRALKKLFKKTGLKPENIDYVCAHATSTQQGDLVEIQALKEALGEHAYKVKINAPKSLLGHTCWSSGIVETVTALMQMNDSKIHGSINIDELDPEIDLNIVQKTLENQTIRHFLKNSFGFGGMNCVSAFKAYEENP